MTYKFNDIGETSIWGVYTKVFTQHKEGDINILSNIRPILLIPSFSKIFKVVLKTQITKHFKDNNLFPTDH
mgnify:CR=1 FL=1